MKEYFVTSYQVQSKIIDSKKQKEKEFQSVNARSKPIVICNISQLLTLILLKYCLIDKSIKEKVETQTTDVILKSFMLLEAKKQVGELATHERVVRAALGDVIIEREGVEVFDALI